MDWMAEALRIGELAGKLLGEFTTADLITSKKDGVELVTNADQAAEDLIVEEIQKIAPDHAILGEEGSAIGGYPSSDYWDPWREKEWLWIVDPLDGTVNFAHGLPVWCVSIGLAHNGELIAGAVVAPPLGFSVETERGGGCWLRHKGERIQVEVSSTVEMSDAVLVTGFPYDKATSDQDNIAQISRVLKQVGGIRRFGSAAIDLCHVACGKVDGYWEMKLKPWDSDAGALAVREAKGLVTQMDGSAWTPFDASILAAGPNIHPHLKKISAALGSFQLYRSPGRERPP